MDKDYSNLIRLLITANDQKIGEESVTTILSRAQNVDASIKKEVYNNYNDIKLFVSSRKAEVYPRHLLLDRLQIKLLDAILLDIDINKISNLKAMGIITKINNYIAESQGDFKLNQIDNILEIIKKMQIIEKVNRSLDLIYYYDIAQKASLQMPYYRNLEQSAIENILKDLEETFPKVRFALSDEAAAKKIAMDCLMSKGITQNQLTPLLSASALFELMKDFYFCGVASLVLKGKGPNYSYTKEEAADTIDLLTVDDAAINDSN